MHHPGGKIQTFLSGDAQEVVYQSLMKAASILAGGKQLGEVNEKDFCLLCCNYIADKLFPGDSCVVLRKNLSFFHVPEDTTASPVEVHDDVYTSGFDKSYFVNRITGTKYNFVLLISFFPRTKTGKQAADLIFPYSVEQGRI